VGTYEATSKPIDAPGLVGSISRAIPFEGDPYGHPPTLILEAIVLHSDIRISNWQTAKVFLGPPQNRPPTLKGRRCRKWLQFKIQMLKLVCHCFSDNLMPFPYFTNGKALSEDTVRPSFLSYLYRSPQV